MSMHAWLLPLLLLAPAQDAPKAKAGTSPFELLPSNHMLIKASVNGGEPRSFIFDVGSPVTLLTNQAAEDAKVVDGRRPAFALFGARGDATIKSFKIGDGEVKDMPVMVMDHPAVSALSEILGKPIDGLIGYTFFSHFRCTIDYQKTEMALVPVEFQGRDLMKTLTEQMQKRGPKVAERKVLSPGGVWGLVVAAPEADAPGVPIREVRPDTPAALAGLQAGDVLTAIDGRWTVSVPDVYAAAAGVEAGREADVIVLRDGKETTLRVTPRAGL